MATLSRAQLVSLMTSVGVVGDDTATMVAIALAESGGRTDAVNINSNGSHDTGLWQINDIWKGQAGMSANIQTFRSQMKDKGKNAIMAAHVKTKQGLTAWTVYKNGNYKKYLNASDTGSGHDAGLFGTADAAISNPGEMFDALTGSLPDPLEGIAGALSAYLDVINRIGQWITDRDNWIRIAQVVGGLGLGYVGFQVVIQPYVAPYVNKAKTIATKGLA